MAAPLEPVAVSQDGMIEGMELAPHTKGLLPFCWSAPFCPEELIRQHTEHLER